MEYAVGRIGRVIVMRFEDGDDVLEHLTALARKEDIRGAVFTLIGGVKAGNIVVGPEDETLPPKPIWRAIEESTEVLGIGTVFWQGDEPKVHLHGSFGKRDAVKVGCLRGASETFLVLEAVVFEIAGVRASREIDPRTGLSLLRVGEGSLG